ncbi:hypothetical protein N9Q05_02715 [bacterium]|nr:hypothetical protein [bacterium]
MGLILTRSPYHVSRRGLDAGASLQITIGKATASGGMSTIYKTYQLAFRNNYFVDVSNLIASEFEEVYTINGSSGLYVNQYNKKFQNRPLLIEFSFEGEINGVAQPTHTEDHYALDGYLYNTDPHNYDFTDTIHNNGSYAGSSDVIYKLDDAPLELPTILLTDWRIAASSLTDNNIDVALYKNGELLETFSNYVDSTDAAAGFSSDYNVPYTFLSFQQRVEVQNGIYERNRCIENFLEEFKLLDVDKVIISNSFSAKVLTIKTISECKYNPYKLIFRNRFGVKESLWFFKKSQSSMKVTNDDFRANQLEQRIAGAEPAVDNTVRSMQQYNKNGIESLTINSGFVVEALNESFKQLMLSEEVTLFDFNNNVLQAVNVKNGELKYKTSVNDKLINYTIDLEMSNNIIDNIA